jgi:hypothetical protein
VILVCETAASHSLPKRQSWITPWDAELDLLPAAGLN